MLPAGPIDDRFDVERLVASGGMGVVYRATDRRSGAPVALKLLRASGSADLERFLREGASLAELRHPHVVSYVAHGRTEDGMPYLAMEWIDGETLASRLSRGPLEAAQSLDLVRCVAGALGEAHARGLVHRDLKPSNLLLPGGDPGAVKVIDFGVVRRTAEVGPTMTGAIVGTLQYMAPEQARGVRDVGPAADVFACGCVLYECLTGRAAFYAADVLAIRAKILLEAPPGLEDLEGDSPGLGDALRRMLAKDPARRPADGHALERLLAEIARGNGAGAIPTVAQTPRRAPTTDSGGLGSDERRFVFVVLAGAAGPVPERTPAPDADLLRRAAAPWASRIEVLPEGPIIALLSGAEAATDLAAKAARCALALRAASPGAPVALVSGHAVLSGRAPVGEVIDRGIAGLRVWAKDVHVDDVTASLLGGRFEVTAGPEGLRLVGESDQRVGVRTLLGRETAYVGREAERATLSAIFRQVALEPTARVALVLGPPGAGKSRLASELRTELAASASPPEVIVASGDPLRAGSPFGLVASAVRRVARFGAGEDADARRTRLSAHVASRLAGTAAERVAKFLGEVSGVPYPDDVELRAARRDPRLLADQVREAVVEWLRSRGAAGPVLFVLEDLHWGDAPSIDLVGAVLDRAADSPILVLALARPDVRRAFPDLFADRDVVEVRLGPLPRRASGKLVRAALGPDATDEVVDRIVERGAGNPYFLEELVRGEAEGAGGASPGSVLAMIQARLEALAPEARRVLRAASIFGLTFRGAAVAALLESAPRGDAIGSVLGMLEMRELVVRVEDSPGADGAYEFRHALVQEAAYATLTDEDRVLGHRLAARWLEAAGEPDAAVLAGHLEAGREPGAAAAWCRAAEQALEGNDMPSALARADRGLALTTDGRARGALRTVQSEAARWNGEHARAFECAFEATKLLEPGSARWWWAAREAASASGRLGRTAQLLEIARAMEETRGGSASARVAGLAMAAVHLLQLGNVARARALETACEAEIGGLDDPAGESPLHALRAALARYVGDAGSQIRHVRAAKLLAERAGDVRATCVCFVNLGYALAASGALEEAEECLERGLTIAAARRIEPIVASCRLNLGLVARFRGRVAEARDALGRAIVAFDRQGDTVLGPIARVYLAAALREGGHALEAAELARAGADRLGHQPSLRAYALAEVARAALALGRTDEAVRAVGEATAVPLDALDAGEIAVRIAQVEVLVATGRLDEARSAARSAKARVLERAARMADEPKRRAYLERVPDPARMLALAAELGD